MNIVIAGGGTAGHVNPAVALARALRDDVVTFIGTPRGVEARVVPAAGFPLEVIDVRGFDRSKPLSIFATGARAIGAVAAARGLLRKIRPTVVVGMGGYVSLPACLAARSLGIPIVLHEQNIVLGLANKVCRPLAAAVGVSFEESLDAAGRRGVYVGNPVSQELVDADREAERKRAVEDFSLEPNRKTLLVFGGSQGAKRINDAALGLREAWRERADVQVLHIAGSVQANAVDRTAVDGPLIYRPTDYVERMVEAYAVADLALCRGGASTIAELCVMGIPSLIVPYPFHRDRQQELHGRVLERHGAAELVPDGEATTERLAADADRLLRDDAKLGAMREAALTLGRPDAARRLAEVVRGVAR